MSAVTLPSTSTPTGNTAGMRVDRQGSQGPSGHGSICQVTSGAALERTLTTLSDSCQLVAVFFSSPWSGPCLHMQQYWESFASDFPEVCFVTAIIAHRASDSAEDDGYASSTTHSSLTSYGVEELPTFLFLRGGRTLGRVVGERPRQLEDALHHYQRQ